MFQNIGGKIRMLAKVVCGLGIAGAVIMLIVSLSSWLSDRGYFPYLIIFLLLAAAVYFLFPKAEPAMRIYQAHRRQMIWVCYGCVALSVINLLLHIFLRPRWHLYSLDVFLFAICFTIYRLENSNPMTQKVVMICCIATLVVLIAHPFFEYNFTYILTTVLTSVGIALGSWIATWLLYGFGEIIDNQAQIKANEAEIQNLLNRR